MGVGMVAARVGAVDTDLLLQHYGVAGPVVERLLGPIPFEWVTLPKGLAGPRIYHGPLSDHTRPKAAVVDVPTAGGVRRYPQLSTSRIEGLVRYGAVEVLSWSPTPSDPCRPAFARLLVETIAGTAPKTLADAMLALRGVFREGGLESVPVFDGGSGAALWIPLTDAPSY